MFIIHSIYTSVVCFLLKIKQNKNFGTIQDINALKLISLQRVEKLINPAFLLFYFTSIFLNLKLKYSKIIKTISWIILQNDK